MAQSRALSRKEIRQLVLDSTRQSNSQVGPLVDDFINLTIAEIENPAWAFRANEGHHYWSFLRQKTTFTTTSGTQDYVLGREVENIAIVRQEDTPVKLTQVPENKFYELVPKPTATGNPTSYRLWEQSGVSTKLTTADTIDVVSSSNSDAGSSELCVSVSGYVGGIWQTETYQLNGTTDVVGTKTYDARDIIVTKQKDTTGTITVKENSGGTTLVDLGPTDRIATFKVISLYPIPDGTKTIYLEYYTSIPALLNDSDVPIFSEKWHYIIYLGALAKLKINYLNDEVGGQLAQRNYAGSIRSMVESDKSNPDIIYQMRPTTQELPLNIRRSDATVS